MTTSVEPELADRSSPSDRTGPGRREARERAIGLIYEAEVKGESAADIVAALTLPPLPYAAGLVEGIVEHGEEIDALINDHSDGWTVQRMPAMDRAVLRVATYELGHCEDVPVAVVLDEAVELAKEYSTEKSGRFVNGVLASLAEVLR